MTGDTGPAVTISSGTLFSLGLDTCTNAADATNRCP
jgi:hypothetical protein